MSRSFYFKLFDHPEKLLTRARDTALKHGLQFSGDHKEGQLSGLGIKAGYLFQEDVLIVTVVRKPLLVPWTTVEHSVRKLINNHQPKKIS